MRKALSIVWAGLLTVVMLVSTAACTSGKKDGAEHDPELRIMSYNLRYASNESPNSWADRRPVMIELLQQSSPDLIGTQEGTYYQLLSLNEGIPEYDWIGVGRQGGRVGEFMAIFYKRDRLELLDTGDFWLSDTPDTVGSSWSRTPRMVTWALFEDKHTKQQFYHLNTHFDHAYEEAREKSAAYILNYIKGLPDLPVIVTGDLNAGPISKPYEMLTADGYLVDTFKAAEEVVGQFKGTFNGFSDNNGRGPIWRIDFILFRGNMDVRKTEIIDFRVDRQYPSDHFPVVTDLTMKAQNE